jgi:predicted type IV restriction endonuclease
MNEAETRAEHIDPALKAAGWGVVEGSRIRREFYITPGYGCYRIFITMVGLQLCG